MDQGVRSARICEHVLRFFIREPHQPGQFPDLRGVEGFNLRLLSLLEDLYHGSLYSLLQTILINRVLR